MFALPRIGRLGVNVQLARAALPLLLRRDIGGCPGFSSTSNVRPPTIANRGRRSFGFTLLELFIVVGIIGLLLVLIAPAFTTIKGGTDVTSAAYTIKGVLDKPARTRKQTTLTRGLVLRVRLEQRLQAKFKRPSSLPTMAQIFGAPTMLSRLPALYRSAK